MRGLRNLAERAGGYRFIQQSVGSARLWRWFVETHVLPRQPARVLDLGCGTADILDYLPETINYTGIDHHQPYVEEAKRRFGLRANFQCEGIENSLLKNPSGFDMVLLLGVLHHCNNERAQTILTRAMNHLTPGGVLLHLDGCLHGKAGWFETMLYRLERGLYIRNQDQYQELMTPHLWASEQQIKDGLLRVPYRYCVGWATRKNKSKG